MDTEGARPMPLRRSDRLTPCLAAVCALAAPCVALGDEPAAPKGEVTRHTMDHGKVFPGTTRDYWVYVPRQYDPARPACVYVNQDGVQYDAPKVFDDLIAKGEMPVTVGVFVTPGKVKAVAPDALDRFNRSFEYDGLGDAYARFLLDELLPEVETLKTADGRAIRLSHDGNDRAIGGASSGAIAAFTAAWERPDAFRRVFSAIGTYVDMRGGNDYPSLVRKVEPKPLRVFLQDGDNDMNIYGGDWWMANQEMDRALRFAGYEVEHAWGAGGHDGKQATEVFPAATRFLWKGWPAPVPAGAGSRQLQEILIPGQGWELVADGFKFTEGPATDAKGAVFFNDVGAGKSYRLDPAGKAVVFAPDARHADGQAFGPDGRLFAASSGHDQVVAFDPEGKVSTFAEGVRGNDVVALHDGRLYVTSPPSGTSAEPGKVYHITPKGEARVVDTGLKFPNGVTASPDQSLLYVDDNRSHWVYSYQIQPDGSLSHKQRFYQLRVPDAADDSGADGMRVDRDGRLYVATRMGIQVCDQAGRVNAIIPTPNGRVANLTFGGEDSDVLYAACGDRVYRRRVKTKGAHADRPPVKPKNPQL